MTTSEKTIDHSRIRQWAERRNGHPALVETKGSGGILRIDFGEPEERLEAISWDRFFEIFEENELAFLYQEKTSDGQISRFNKFVERDGR